MNQASLKTQVLTAQVRQNPWTLFDTIIDTDPAAAGAVIRQVTGQYSLDPNQLKTIVRNQCRKGKAEANEILVKLLNLPINDNGLSPDGAEFCAYHIAETKKIRTS